MKTETTETTDVTTWMESIILDAYRMGDSEIGPTLTPFDGAVPTAHEIARRDRAMVAFALRCLGNPECDGSERVLDAIMGRREEARAGKESVHASL